MGDGVRFAKKSALNGPVTDIFDQYWHFWSPEILVSPLGAIAFIWVQSRRPLSVAI